MVTNQVDRVWLVPQKFWSATKGMSAEETEKLVDRLMSLSEVGDFATLQKFDFIVIGKAGSGRKREHTEPN
jgi:hypothetical protein